MDMPYSIGSVVVSNDDGTYSIFLNSRQCYEKNKCDLKHELMHIKNGDVGNCIDVQNIEYKTHKKDVK